MVLEPASFKSVLFSSYHQPQPQSFFHHARLLLHTLHMLNGFRHPLHPIQLTRCAVYQDNMAIMVIALQVSFLSQTYAGARNYSRCSVPLHHRIGKARRCLKNAKLSTLTHSSISTCTKTLVQLAEIFSLFFLW